MPVPQGKAVYSVDEAEQYAKEIKSNVAVVKAQIHAGGRGKAGGVKLARDKKDVAKFTNEILGKVLVTHQTGPEGRCVRKLLIEEGVDIAKELYLSLLIDRTYSRPVFITSLEGGMEIEEVAARTPEKVIKEYIDPSVGYQQFNGRNMAFRLGLPPEIIKQFISMAGNLYRLLTEKGASLIEINPLVITKDNRLIALDAKMSFDDNSLFKNEDVRAFRDLDEEEDLEIEASKHGLNYVKLNGNIGCMVNGAGLAMATMDVIKLAGSEPANFLDVGGGASKETVKHAFQILLADKNVRGVFVNIFGGIVRCERIAGGIIEAAKEVEIKVPLVIRLEGTNAKEGLEMLKGSGLNLQVASDIWEGAQKVVKLVGGA
ncbi:MAG: succinate--CoA ligase subunit beta [Nitrospirae bacterium RIFCSPLOW2_12_42_9]|nr:MAG: succinate--CoA ligase subunit beta [Nitrospirae bacterium RIFCSPLOW2_12_42_9]